MIKVFLPFCFIMIKTIEMVSQHSECIFLNNSTVEAEVQHNTNATFVFTVSKACRENIVFFEALTEEQQLYCFFTHSGSVCAHSSKPSVCSCNSALGEYVVIRQVTKYTGARWVIEGRSRNDTIFKATFNVRVTYPPTIHSFKFIFADGTSYNHYGIVAKEHDTITMQCTWDEGNPPTSARLLKNNGTQLPARERRQPTHEAVRQLEFVIRDVQCSDSGEFTCLAHGAAASRSLYLSVLCTGKSPHAEPSLLAVGLDRGMGSYETSESSVSQITEYIEKKPTTVDFNIILYSSIGGICLLAVVFFGIFCYRKRKVLSRRRKQHTNYMKPCMQNSSSSSINNFYEEIDDYDIIDTKSNCQRQEIVSFIYLHPIPSASERSTLSVDK